MAFAARQAILDCVLVEVLQLMGHLGVGNRSYVVAFDGEPLLGCSIQAAARLGDQLQVLNRSKRRFD